MCSADRPEQRYEIVDVNTLGVASVSRPGVYPGVVSILKLGFDLCLLRMKPFGKAR